MNPDSGTPDTPAPSATVLMLRDAPGGLEVFLLKRHGLSAAFGGAHVFPGGKRDAGDAGLADRLDQPPAALREALGEPELDGTDAAALYVAAIREVFEESGVLFADLAPGQLHEALALQRAGRPFAEVVAHTGVPLRASALLPWSRWITPQVSWRRRKRFDARFFVAAVPEGQEPVHDQHEATESVWLTPAAALRQYWAGEMELAAPQIMSLAQLARQRNVAGVLRDAGSRRPPRILPVGFQQEGFDWVCYPGDPRHPEREPVLHGPSRLCWREGRYQPDGGLAALLG